MNETTDIDANLSTTIEALRQRLTDGEVLSQLRLEVEALCRQLDLAEQKVDVTATDAVPQPVSSALAGIHDRAQLIRQALHLGVTDLPDTVDAELKNRLAGLSGEVFGPKTLEQIDAVHAQFVAQAEALEAQKAETIKRREVAAATLEMLTKYQQLLDAVVTIRDN